MAVLVLTVRFGSGAYEPSSSKNVLLCCEKLFCSETVLYCRKVTTKQLCEFANGSYELKVT